MTSHDAPASSHNGASTATPVSTHAANAVNDAPTMAAPVFSRCLTALEAYTMHEENREDLTDLSVPISFLFGGLPV